MRTMLQTAVKARGAQISRDQASAKFQKVFSDFKEAEADYLQQVGARKAETEQKFSETARYAPRFQTCVHNFICYCGVLNGPVWCRMIAAILFQFATRAAGALEGAAPPTAPAVSAAPAVYTATIMRSAQGLGMVLNTNAQQDAVVTNVSGAALASGIRPGSVIMAVQGTAVGGRRAGHAGVIDLIKRSPPTAPIELTLRG